MWHLKLGKRRVGGELATSREEKEMDPFVELNDGSFRPAIFEEYGTWRGRTERISKQTNGDWKQDGCGIEVRIIVFFSSMNL